MHPVVAVVALICATVAACFTVWSLTNASDAGAIAIAIGSVLSAATLAYARMRGGRSQDPPA